MGDVALHAVLPNGRLHRLDGWLHQYFTSWLDLREPIPLSPRDTGWMRSCALEVSSSGHLRAAEDLRTMCDLIDRHGYVSLEVLPTE